MNAPAKPNTIDPLLYPRDVAKLLGVSMSWLAKARLRGDGPRFVKIGRSVRTSRPRTGRPRRFVSPSQASIALIALTFRACQGPTPVIRARTPECGLSPRRRFRR